MIFYHGGKTDASLGFNEFLNLYSKFSQQGSNNLNYLLKYKKIKIKILKIKIKIEIDFY